ncbi:hypothetical protein ACHWQZ_G003537 [Mnemiopsis leidyi]
MFHACCRKPGASSTSSTAICPKSSYTAVSTLIRKEASDAHKDRWGQFMFLYNKCKKQVVDLKKEDTIPKVKMVSVACDTGVSYEDKSSNTGDHTHESINSTDESPEINLSDRGLQKIMESFKERVLDSVDNLRSQKLNSYNNSMTRTPRPSSDSSVADSAAVSEISLTSSNSSGYKLYLGAFQSTPLPSTSGQAKDKAKSALEKTLEGSRILVDEGKKMFPKITVTNIPNYLVSHILTEKSTQSQMREKLSGFVKEKFLEKNEVVSKIVVADKRTFEVIYVKSGENFTTVEVSPVIRKYLIEQGWIYIGETRCKVMDRIDQKQCFKCQRVGHVASQCRNNMEFKVNPDQDKWVNSEVQSARRLRSKAERDYRCFKTDESKKSYRAACKNAEEVTNSRRDSYFCQQLEQSIDKKKDTYFLSEASDTHNFE